MASLQPRIPTYHSAETVVAVQVADHLGCSRRALKAATPQQCQSIFGYLPGIYLQSLHVSKVT